MKKWLFLVLCTVVLNVSAQTSEREMLLQIIEPAFKTAIQVGLDKESEGQTAERDACVNAVFEKLATPKVIDLTVNRMRAEGLSKELSGLTEYFAHPVQRAAFGVRYAHFYQLYQSHQNAEAQKVWWAYMNQASSQTPEHLRPTLQRIFEVVGEIDYGSLLSDQEIEQEVLVNPSCQALFISK